MCLHTATSHYKKLKSCLAVNSTIYIQCDVLTVLRFLLGSGQRHVETPWVIQEADALVLIGTYTRQDDEVLLSALEGIYAGNFHLL